MIALARTVLFLFIATWVGSATGNPILLELHGVLVHETLEHRSISPQPSSALVLISEDRSEVRAFAPQGQMYGRYNRERRLLAPFEVEKSTLRIQDGRLSGELRAQYTDQTKQSGSVVVADVRLRADRNAEGVWRGTWSRGTQTGTVTGRAMPMSTARHRTLMLTIGNNEFNSRPGIESASQVLLSFEGDRIVETQVNSAAGRATAFGGSTSFPLPIITLDGVRTAGNSPRDQRMFDADVISVELSGDLFGGQGRIVVSFDTFKIDSDHERTGPPQRRQLNVEVRSMGGVAWGEGALDDRPVNVFGYWSDSARKHEHERVTLPPLDANPAIAIQNRLAPAIEALTRHPTLTRFSSPVYPTSFLLGGGGGKQYDHRSMNGFAGINAFLLAADHLGRTDDLAAACRAGTWLTMVRSRAGMASVYKTGFWWTAYQGLGFVDLYQATKDDYWLELAKEYAEVVKRAQLASGAWTWVDPDSGSRGRSFLRGSNDFDGRELLNSEILLFLGKLRQAGVTDYVDVEEKALAWHRRTIAANKMDWHSRRSPYPFGHEKIKPGEDRVQAFPMLTYLRYLLDYRQDATADEVDAVLKIVRDAGLYVTGGPFAPSVIGYEPRQSREDLHQPATYTTAQLAVIELLRAKRFNLPDARKHAVELVFSVLNVQEPDTGLIDHLGRDLAGWNLADPDRLRSEQHHYSALRVLTLMELVRARQLLEEAEKTGAIVPRRQWIDFPKIGHQDAGAVTIKLSATASSGLDVEVKVTAGPARVEGRQLILTGEPGIVHLAAAQPGNDRFLAADRVTQVFAVGQPQPSPIQGLEGRPMDASTLRLTWRPAPEEEVIGYVVEARSAPDQPWQRIARPRGSSVVIDGLAAGSEQRYRIIARSAFFESLPSAEIVIAPHQKVVAADVRAADMNAGAEWQVQDDDGAPSGQRLTALAATWTPEGHTEPTEALSVVLPFVVEDVTGRFFVHYLCWGNSGRNDSIWFRYNDQPWDHAPITNTGSWEWRTRMIEVGEPGRQVVSFAARQSTTRSGTPAPSLARIVISNDPQPPAR